MVVRSALEVLLRHASSPDVDPLLPQLRHLLDAPDRYVRQAAWQTVARLDVRQREYVAQDLSQASPRMQVSYALAITQHQRQPDHAAFDLAWHAFGATSDPILRLDAIRAAQKACGDFGGASQLPPVYDGYANKFSLRRTDFSPFHEPLPIIHPPPANPALRRTEFIPFHEAELPIDLQSLTAAFPSGNDHVDQELARLFALLAPDSPALAEKLAGKLSDTSHPVDDIHYLIVLSRFSIPLPASIRDRIATALVQLEPKLRARGLQQDLNWDLRIGELYQELVRHDQQLARIRNRTPAVRNAGARGFHSRPGSRAAQSCSGACGGLSRATRRCSVDQRRDLPARRFQESSPPRPGTAAL